jgi:hypothetical protein
MVAKVKLVEVEWDANQNLHNPVSGGKVVDAHFNPETLKVTYSNQNRGGNQPSGGGGQFVGSANSKLSVDLLFDTSEVNQDVRRITQDVAYFIKPQDPNRSGGGDSNSANRVPPSISFEWGTFLFRGVVDSLDETLEYFSEEGVPLRASVTLSITKQDISFEFGQPGQAGGGAAQADNAPPAGTQPLSPARPGDSLQQLAARFGRSGDWKAIAAANGINNPLRLEAGALVNMNASASLGGGLSAGVGASAGAAATFSAGAGLSAGAGAGLSGGGQVGFSAGLGAGTGFSAGASGSLGGSAGFGASASAGFGASATAGAGASGSVGFGGAASFGASAQASAGLTGTASAGGQAGAAASASASARAGRAISASRFVNLLEE